MAKEHSDYQDIMAKLKKREFSPIYVLHGDEPYYIDMISNYIANNILTPEERDFNQTVLYGADTSDAEIADSARRYPMMSEHQVVIVKEAQTIKKWEQLEAYLDKPQSSSIVVICHKGGKIDGRRKLVSKANKIGVVFESTKCYESALPSFITGYMKDTYPNISIDGKAVQMVAEHVGTDLSRIVSELDKAATALPNETGNITPEIVEAKIGISKEYNSFELQDAIANHDVEKALRIANFYASDPKANSSKEAKGPYTVVPMIFNFFQNLMILYYKPGTKNPQEIASYLGVGGGYYAANRYLNAMRYYSAQKTLLIIAKIRQIDARMKGLDNPSTPMGELLRELVIFILN